MFFSKENNSKILNQNNFSNEEKEILDRFEEYQIAMIDKDMNKLNDIGWNNIYSYEW